MPVTETILGKRFAHSPMPMLHPASRLRLRIHARGFTFVEVMLATVILALFWMVALADYRIGDQANLRARIDARLGRMTRRASDIANYAPYDRLPDALNDAGFLHRPNDPANPGAYLSLYPYQVTANVAKHNVNTAQEYADVSFSVAYEPPNFYTGTAAGGNGGNANRDGQGAAATVTYYSSPTIVRFRY